MNDLIQLPWSERWLGGFCPLGALEGLPVRGSGYPAHPPLAQLLTLPAENYPTVSAEAATQAWSAWCGGAEVILVCNADRAWRLLLWADEVEHGDVVGVPANATSDLVEAIKHYGAHPRFLGLNAHLGVCPDPTLKVNWAQAVNGLPTEGAGWLDYSDSLPIPALPHAKVAVYGLHLNMDRSKSGALMVFADEHLAKQVKGCLMPQDLPNPSLALAQLARLKGLYPQQQAALQETWTGLSQAAALPMLPLAESGALAQGVAVQIPLESDVATFYTYVQQENTPVQWLPTLRPLHYAAVREVGRHAESACHLARWLFVPVGPSYTSEEIKHAVLGIVKASEYLGVRCRTNPSRAREYAALLTQMYGAEHDAYRPVFEV